MKERSTNETALAIGRKGDKIAKAMLRKVRSLESVRPMKFRRRLLKKDASAIESDLDSKRSPCTDVDPSQVASKFSICASIDLTSRPKPPRPKITFEDGYVKSCEESELEKKWNENNPKSSSDTSESDDHDLSGSDTCCLVFRPKPPRPKGAFEDGYVRSCEESELEKKWNENNPISTPDTRESDGHELSGSDTCFLVFRSKPPRPKVTFEDGYVTSCKESELEKKWNENNPISSSDTSESDGHELSGSDTRVTAYFSRAAAGYISAVLLVLATISKSSLDMLYVSAHPSSAGTESKLGPAAMSSLTEALSPILPFAGGMDLRREEYSLRDLLPTSTFDTWESFHWNDWDNIWGQARSSFGGKSSQEVAAEKSITPVNHIPRGGGAVPHPATTKKDRLARRKRMESHPSVLSAADPFVSTDEISLLTLEDVSEVFRFTMESNREGFNETEFYMNVSPKLRETLRAIDDATAKSRGSHVLPAFTKAREEESSDEGPISKHGFGDIDTLQFLAAMRIFAEWRILRQVPEGYRGYAVGMGLGHKDVVQNVAKIESAVLAWIEERTEFIEHENLRRTELKQARKKSGDVTNSDDACEDYESEEEPLDDYTLLVLRSPTLRELLQVEVDIDLHDGKLPRLKEKSAGMGLLWVRRQLHYQTAIFSNVRGGSYSSAHDAVAAAYQEVYNMFHGWAVQKIFNYSFQSAPDVEEIYKVMNPEHLELLLAKAKNTPPANDDGFTIATNYADDMDYEGQKIRDVHVDHFHAPENVVINKVHNHGNNPFVKLGNHIGTEWDKLSNHVIGEWDKLAGSVMRVLHLGHKNHVHLAQNELISHSHMDVRGGGRRKDSIPFNEGSPLSGEELENFITEELSRESIRQIGVYLEVAKPILNDLAGLFDEMNMDDPTKV